MSVTNCPNCGAAPRGAVKVPAGALLLCSSKDCYVLGWIVTKDDVEVQK